MNNLRSPYSASENKCLDLSLRRIFALVFFPISDPGREYDIVLGTDIEHSSYGYPKEGDTVTVKYGAARCQGTVVKVSDTLQYIAGNFNQLVMMHQSTLRREETKFIPMFSKISSYMKSDVDAPIKYINYIKSERSTMDSKATQTDYHSERPDSNIDQEKKYEDLKTKYQKIYTLVLDLKKDMDSLSKVTNSKRGGNINTTNDDTEDKENVDDFFKPVQIGSKGIKIPKDVYDSIDWSTYTTATRKLLVTLFPKKVLATHSLTGIHNPVFLTRNKEPKNRLNPNIISDIVEVVSRKSNVPESLVRSAITTKCAEESTLYKNRKRLRKGGKEEEADLISSKKKTSVYDHVSV